METERAQLKERAIKLRKRGKTYKEINTALGCDIPKSTFSCWMKGVELSALQKKRIDEKILKNLKLAQSKALVVNKKKREKYLQSVHERVMHLPSILNTADVAKIALAMLYMGEGGKTRKGSAMFGNSSPKIVALFMRLLRNCYEVDESKFRCTVQLRADQDIEKAEKFWRSITGISKKQFYKARIDPRTIGKISRNKEYKGVCRVEYFSADVYNEILAMMEVICEGGNMGH